jgi:hypothetical protein
MNINSIVCLLIIIVLSVCFFQFGNTKITKGKNIIETFEKPNNFSELIDFIPDNYIAVKSDAKITDPELEEFKQFMTKLDQNDETEFIKYMDNEHMAISNFELHEKSIANESKKYRIYSFDIKYSVNDKSFLNRTYAIKNISDPNDSLIFLNSRIHYSNSTRLVLESKDFIKYKSVSFGTVNYGSSTPEFFDSIYTLLYLPLIGNLMILNRPTEEILKSTTIFSLCFWIDALGGFTGITD